MLTFSGLENSTRPLVFTSASGCSASEKLIFLVNIIFSQCMPIVLVMQGKCLFSDISRPDFGCCMYVERIKQ